MIDQYIYTRVGSSSGKNFGHDFAAITSGISANNLQQDVKTVARYNNTVKDHEGKLIKVLEKRNVGGGKYGVLQQSVLLGRRNRNEAIPEGDERRFYYSDTDRDQLLAHGYVFSVYDSSQPMLDVDKWFYVDFIDHNVNLKPVEMAQLDALRGEATPLEPLPLVLEKAGLTLEQFITAVRASFDTQNRDTIELLELDYSRPDAKELGAQLLRWLFHFLPYAMRRQADFSTCYDTGCGGHEFSLALIPSAMLTVERGGRVTFRGMPNSAKFGYIFAKGTVTHGTMSSRKDFDTENTLYGQWLEQVIRLVYGQSLEEGKNTLAILNGIYAAFDAYIYSQDEKDQCRTEFYDALCWVYLENMIPTAHIGAADQAVAAHPRNTAAYADALLSLKDQALLKRVSSLILDHACFSLSAGYNTDWLKTLERLKAETGDTQEIREVESVYLAKLFDTAAPSGLFALLKDYFQTTAPAGISETDKVAAIDKVLFPEGGCTENRWNAAGCSRELESNLKRLGVYARAYVTDTGDCATYLNQSRKLLRGMKDFGQKHMNTALSSGEIPVLDITACTIRDNALFQGSVYGMMDEFADYPAVAEGIRRFYFDTSWEAVNYYTKQYVENTLQALPNIIRILDELVDAFKPLMNIEDCKVTFGDFVELAIKKIWLPNAKRQYQELGIAGCTFLENAPGQHPALVRTLLHVHDLDQESKLTSLLSGCYEYALIFLTNKPYTCRNLAWYQEAIQIFEQFRSRMPVNDRFVGMFENYKKAVQFLSNGQGDCNYLYDLDRRGDKNLPRYIKEIQKIVEEDPSIKLSVEARYYCGLRAGDGKTYSKSLNYKNGLGLVLKQNGARGVIALLDQYPNAAEAQTASGNDGFLDGDKHSGGANFGGKISKLFGGKRNEEDTKAVYTPRDGKYPWMSTDSTFAEKLYEFVTVDGAAALKNAMERDEMLAPDLVTCVSALLPAGSALERVGTDINNEFQRLWQEAGNSGPNAKKAMSAHKKNGAFGRGR